MRSKPVAQLEDGPIAEEFDVTTSAGTDPRPMRADAAKNQASILAAAEEIFAEVGLSVPVDDVARRAGVGVGTLYRHFPTKEALFEAVVVARIERLVESAEDYARADDAGEALFAFLREFAVQAAAKRDLIDGLERAGFDFKSRCSASVDVMMERIDILLRRAQQAEAIRSDVGAKEVIDLLAGAIHAGGHSVSDAVMLQRMVGIVIDGLRPQPDRAGTSGR